MEELENREEEEDGLEKREEEEGEEVEEEVGMREDTGRSPEGT